MEQQSWVSLARTPAAAEKELLPIQDAPPKPGMRAFTRRASMIAQASAPLGMTKEVTAKTARAKEVTAISRMSILTKQAELYDKSQEDAEELAKIQRQSCQGRRAVIAGDLSMVLDADGKKRARLRYHPMVQKTLAIWWHTARQPVKGRGKPTEVIRRQQRGSNPLQIHQKIASKLDRPVNHRACHSPGLKQSHASTGGALVPA